MFYIFIFLYSYFKFLLRNPQLPDGLIAQLVELGVALVSGFSGGGGGGEERKGKREEKPDTKALRRVFRPHASPYIVANPNNFRSCNCHVSDDRCERYELKLHRQLHCKSLSKQNIFC